MYVRTYVRTYVCMYLCMYVCMYVCAYIHACAALTAFSWPHDGRAHRFSFCAIFAEHFLSSGKSTVPGMNNSYSVHEHLFI